MLASVAPLWRPEQFYFFDKFADSDPYEDENYRNCFRTLLQAQKQNRYVDIDYTSPNGRRVHHHYIPARLEYSVKNDKFRILALKPVKPAYNKGLQHETQRGEKMKLEILNVSRIQSVQLMEKTLSFPVDIDEMIQCSYYKEPLKLRIVNKRNALERAMLHFANYEKNTTKIDEDTYECLIYYNQNMETELLIEVMSFGPMLAVIENERFLNDMKARLQKQMKLGMQC